jgi:hypothetical protein
VNTCVLDVFGDSVNQKFTLVGDSVDIDLLSVINELRNDDRMIR